MLIAGLRPMCCRRQPAAGCNLRSARRPTCSADPDRQSAAGVGCGDLAVPENVDNDMALVVDGDMIVHVQ